MRVLLVSTYELGHQPIHIASPAAKLIADGVEVRAVDLSVQELDLALLDEVDAVAFSVPMHTAMRLAMSVASDVRRLRPGLPIAFYGLYATVGSEWTAGHLGHTLIAGEYETALCQWVRDLRDGTDQRGGVDLRLDRTGFVVPDRSGLPSHDAYARLEWQGEARLAAAVEASHGCRHRCRHCPIPVLYDGRLRVIGSESVLSDIAQLVDAGVQHVTFSDPDFLNAPRYSLDILREAHAAHPELTFDVTVKVEHVLKHRERWPQVAETGVLFVVSAFESVDELTLGILDKNHTVSDMEEAVSVLREADVHPRPTWLPFLPWTRPDDLIGIVRFLDRQRLWRATDPVQLAIKLLIPEGSLLEKHPSVTPYLTTYEPESLTWRWRFDSQDSELLHKELDAVAAAGSDCGEDAMTTLTTMRDLIGRIAGVDLGPMPDPGPPTPRLTESWFCCAEPTAGQATAVGLSVGRVPADF